MTFTKPYTTKLAGAFFARTKILLAIAGILLLSLLIACAPPEDDDDGGSVDTYTIGGTVAGHTGEVSLKLTYGEETETLKIETGTDKFTFAAKLEDKQSFTIDVTAPQGQSCSSSVTQGTIVNANITNVTVTCSGDAPTTYTVSGSVTGADDYSQITITLSHGDAGPPPANIVSMETTPNTDGTFTFDIPANKVYLLSVASATTDEVCTPDVTTFSAPITTNVTDADIVCAPAAANTYTVGGTISGLANGEAITLTLTPTGSVAETKVITGDAFVFNTRLTNGDTYTVTTTPPTGKKCTVAPEGEQTVADGDVTDIAVTCVLATYSISGTINGAGDTTELTITLSHGDPANPSPVNLVTLVFSPNDGADTTFSFTGIPANKVYLISVDSDTANEVCTPDDTTFSAPITADVTDADISCSINIPAGTTYSVSGDVSGLKNGETFTLALTPTGSGAENKAVSGDDVESSNEFITFNTRLASGDTYTVAVLVQPNDKTCTVDNAGTRTMGDADVIFQVTCVPSKSVSGSVSGLATGETVTLALTPTGGVSETENVTGDDDETANDAFAFDTRLATGTTYTVTVTSSPADKVCRVDNAGTRTMGDADVTDVTVTCVPSTYSVSGAVSGTADNSQITITLLHVDPPVSNPTGAVTIDVTASTDGTFTITGIPEDKHYLLSATSATANESCIPAVKTFRDKTSSLTNLSITCTIAAANTYAIGGAVSGLESGESIILTLNSAGGTTEKKVITADADATTTDSFTFGTKLANGTTYTVEATSLTGKNCRVAPAGEQTMGDANVTDIAVNCTATHMVSGKISGSVNILNVYVVLIYYDDNTGTGGTTLSDRSDLTETFSIADIPANKFYTLQAFSTNSGEICSGGPTTPTQLTADVTDVQITCAPPNSPSVKIQVLSVGGQASLATVNVFIGDDAVPATTGTPTRVIRGTDADVYIISNTSGTTYDFFIYELGIDAGQHYAVTVTSGAETCAVTSGGTGGPVTASAKVAINCD